MNDSEGEHQTDRGRFLKRVGKMAAVGLGLALIPAQAAYAASECCPDSSCPGCPGGQFPVRCTDTCHSVSCCSCSTQNQCHGVPCPCV